MSPNAVLAPTHRCIRIRDAEHTLLDEVHDFAIEGRLQTVRDMTDHFLLQVDWSLPYRFIERNRTLNCLNRCLFAADDLNQRNEMRRIERWPMTQRSGCLHCDWLTPIGIPDELEARIVVAGVSASMSANSLILKSAFSGPFSWTKSTPCSASSNFVVNESRSLEAPTDNPNCSRQATHCRIFAQFLFGAWSRSVATTSIPCAKNSAAQLAPITPVPTIAIRQIAFPEDIGDFSSLRHTSAMSLTTSCVKQSYVATR